MRSLVKWTPPSASDLKHPQAVNNTAQVGVSSTHQSSDFDTQIYLEHTLGLFVRCALQLSEDLISEVKTLKDSSRWTCS